MIQHHVRTWLAYRHKLTAVRTIQRWWRAASQRRAFIRSVVAICCIQRWWRVRLLRRHIVDAIVMRRELFTREQKEEEGVRFASFVLNRSPCSLFFHYFDIRCR